tara:strand:- start:224 stop:469 length:246 start_codon:yes stop_codon:yes gene_type:complete
MKSSPIKLKQKLSPSAAKKKAERDLAAANSPYRKRLRADSQKKRRKKSSAFLKGKDYDHRTSSFKSVKYNRGGGGKGTKNE